MSYLIQPDYVQYLCTCGQLKPIINLYFCRHCLEIRCGFCISHEVDSHYCAHCLENMPSSEARLKKNRCSSCFDCPSCFHTLSTRAQVAQPKPSPEGGDTKVENKQPKKMFYLSCFNCRWTSRDVGIPDQPVAAGGWPERPSPFATRINQLLEYYKAMAQQEKKEKMDKERKKFTIRGKYITLTDKTGLTGAMARGLAGLPADAHSLVHSFAPASASEQVDELPDDFLTKEVDLNAVTSVSQRLAHPGVQPALSSQLVPAPRALAVKRSQRCARCDHNLTKPEYNPGSVKFKIELLAFYHVPEVKIISCDALKPGQESYLLLKLTNPTAYEMQIQLLQPEDKIVLEDGEEKTEIVEQRSPPLPPCNCRLVLPRDATLSLSQRDEAAEYDDDTASTKPQHDMIVWRKSNKLAVRVPVLPSADCAGPAAAALVVLYSYRSVVPARPGPAARRLAAGVVLTLGDVGNN